MADESGRNDGRRRAVTPVVGKTLELALVLLFVAGISTTLFGGIVPDYRTGTGTEVADRTVVSAAERVDGAVPPAVRSARVVRSVPLPGTIRGTAYRIVATDGALTLEHPTPGIDATARLALPERVVSVEGTWHSGAETAIVVESEPDGLHADLVNR